MNVYPNHDDDYLNLPEFAAAEENQGTPDVPLIRETFCFAEREGLGEFARIEATGFDLHSALMEAIDEMTPSMIDGVLAAGGELTVKLGGYDKEGNKPLAA